MLAPFSRFGPGKDHGMSTVSSPPPRLDPAATPAEKPEAQTLQVARIPTLLFGVLGLIILCPLVQWLELGSKESASFSSIGLPPVAVLILCGMVLSVVLASLFKKFSPRADFILLYAMFMVGTTICSTGLIRPIYGHITAVMDELIDRKVDTVAPGYNVLKPEAFPKLTTPLITIPNAITEEEQRAAAALRAKRDEEYRPLVEYAKQLRRDTADSPPNVNHENKLYRIAPGTGILADTGLRLKWWYRERFLRDNFGAIKKDVEAWKLIQNGATPVPTETMPGVPQPTIDRIKADPPGGFAVWFSDKILTNVKATHALAKIGGGIEVETRTIPWSLWAMPIINWSIFSLMIIALLLCLAEVLRRIWLRIENLPMPLVEVPDGLISLLPGGTRRPESVQWLLPIGVVIGAIWVSVFAAQHFGLPGFSGINPAYTSISLTNALQEIPFKYIGGSQINFSPLLIAVGLLVSIEVSRSVWGIYGLSALALMVLGVLGISAATVVPPVQIRTYNYREFPFWDDQFAGALMMMAIWLLWASRWRLVEILAGIWRPPEPAKLGDPLISPRLLPILLLVLLIALPCYMWYMGLTSVKLLAIVLGVFLLFAIAGARLRAETGFLLAPAMPLMSRYNLMLGGAWSFGAQGSAAGNSFFVLSNSLISTILPQTLEITAMAQRQRVSLRRIFVGMMLAAGVALAIGMPFMLFWQYSQSGIVDNGSGGKDAMYMFYRFAGRDLDQGQFETVRIVATCVGAAVMLVLLVCRSFFLSFPLHPIGYVVVAGYTAGQYFNPQGAVNILWGPMLIAWLIKRTIFKVGGTELFGRLLPLFKGVIVGHLLAIVFWAVLRALAVVDPTKAIFFIW